VVYPQERVLKMTLTTAGKAFLLTLTILFTPLCPAQTEQQPETLIYRQIDGRSYEIVIKVDGATAATATAAVSSDGATMTVTTVWM